MSDGQGGWRRRVGGFVIAAFAWGKRNHALWYLYTRVPFRWRLALRRRLHAAAGTPMPPLPFPNTEHRIAESDCVLLPPIRPGANLLGYARGEFGIAQNMRAYARAIERTGYPFVIFNFDVGDASRQQDRSMEAHFSSVLRYATNVFFINADQLPIAHGVLGSNALGGHYNIGFWLWELEKFPHDWRSACHLVDEIWVPTEFIRAAVAAATDRPVLRMPAAIEFNVPDSMGRAHFGLPPELFIFLFSYDFNSFSSRKNPEGVVAAFRQAFGDGAPDARLLIKTTNGERARGQLDALRQAVADDPRIEVRDGFLSRDEMFGLENAVDCYVSLHRAEGLGLGMAESMYLGKPVIATRYSGNLDFMDDDNSLLVDCRMIPLHDGDYMYWRGQVWADPDVAQAARCMRRLFDDRAFAASLGARAAASVRRTHSQAACGAAVHERLVEIDRMGMGASTG